MHMHGIVMSATLQDDPHNPDQVELLLAVQGVGAGQPRKVIIPMSLLVAKPEIDPETIKGHSFQAEVVQDEDDSRWVVTQIDFAARRVLRPDSS